MPTSAVDGGGFNTAIELKVYVEIITIIVHEARPR